MEKYNWHETAKQQWDERADFWSKNSVEMWENGSRKSIIPFFTKYLKEYHLNQILDIGCGDGYGSYKLHQQGFKVQGVDISASMIEKAKQKGGNEDLSFLQADINHLPFKTESFDGLMSINCIEWTETPLFALNEVRRVLKKGAIACFCILGPAASPRSNSYQRLYDEKVICNTMMPWEFAQLCQENGWDLLGSQGIYTKEVTAHHIAGLSEKLKQSLSFSWLFIIQKSAAE